MSHLSSIKTSITNQQILEKTLEDLGLNSETINNLVQKKDIIVKKNKETLFKFLWKENEYSLIADLSLWSFDMPYERLLDKITQQYSYNFIIKESAKYGFTSNSLQSLSDGSIRLTVERWN